MLATLEAVSIHLHIVHAVAEIVCAALEAQGADIDRSAATVLRRCVLDPLADQIERVEKLIGGGAS